MGNEPMSLLRYDPAGVFLSERGISQADLQQIQPRLEAARDEVVDTDMRLFRGPAAAIPPEKQPLDAGFFDLPDRLLLEYRESRADSEIARILATADRLRDAVDRVVVLGIGGSYMGARALMESCCQPYFNELSRGQRGGYPRMYFQGNNLDNDASQGLLSLLSQAPSPESRPPSQALDDRWAIVVISKSGGTLETAVAFRQFLRALDDSTGHDPALTAQRVVPVTGASGKLFELSQALGCPDMFQVPDGVGGRFSVLSAVGLLPAAMLGLDIVKLLEGAAAMNAHFREAPPGRNAVLDYVGVSHLLEEQRGAGTRVLSVWSNALESIGLWYDQLLAESLGKHERGATPITTVNTRDLHSRAQQHQEGRRDKLFTNLIVDAWRNDSMPVGSSDHDQDDLNRLSDKTLPDLMRAAIQGTNRAYRDDGRPTADIHLPRVDEAIVGQLFQMFMLATVVEGRLIGVNPYGQPGVEAYKRNMQQILDQSQS